MFALQTSETQTQVAAEGQKASLSFNLSLTAGLPGCMAGHNRVYAVSTLLLLFYPNAFSLITHVVFQLSGWCRTFYLLFSYVKNIFMALTGSLPWLGISVLLYVTCNKG